MNHVHIPPRIILDAMLKDTIALKICILHPTYRKRWYRDCDRVLSISAALAKEHCQEICLSV